MKKNGHIIFVGAGCGDPELLTIKGMKALQNADVVLADRLVSPQILTDYVSPNAEIIYVGKQCRKGYSTKQWFINELMVQFAREQKNIVRLKGGDVSILSNILDELEALEENGITYEIVPGITAALGAAAYTGIPLTARGHATAVRFLTAYKSDILPEPYWKELANTSDTLVFYMSSETLPMVQQNLCRLGIDEDKQLAIIEQATTPNQRIRVQSLYSDLPDIEEFVSPTLVIIGKVVDLHARFSWFSATGNENAAYFTHSANPIFSPVKSNTC